MTRPSSGEIEHRGMGALRKIALNAGAMAVAGIVAQICFTTIEAIVARRLGQHAYGVYGSANALSMCAAWLVEFGMAWKLVQDGSRLPQEIPGILGTTLVLKVMLGCVVAPLAFLALQAVGYSPEVRQIFPFFFGYAVLVALQDSLAALYSARQEMHVTALFQGAAPVAIALCIVIVGQLSQSLSAVGGAYLAGGGLITGLWLWRTWKSERPHVEMQRTKQILQGSWHYGLTGVLSQVYWRVDLLMLPLLRGLDEVGLFAAADKLTDLGLKVGVLCTRVLAPVMFAQSHEDPGAYARTCKITLRMASIAGVLGCLILAFLAEPLVTLIFGARFRPAAAILQVLTASLALRLIAITLQVVLSSSDEHTRRTSALAFAIAGAAGGNLAAVPGYGPVGAAVARVFGDVINVSVMLCAPGLPFPRSAAISWVLRPLLLGVGAYVFARALHTGPIVTLGVGVGLYGLGVVVSQAVRLTELRDLVGQYRARPSA
jgi:O-antigen/teichoic acid export membrane protein